MSAAIAEEEQWKEVVISDDRTYFPDELPRKVILIGPHRLLVRGKSSTCFELLRAEYNGVNHANLDRFFKAHVLPHLLQLPKARRESIDGQRRVARLAMKMLVSCDGSGSPLADEDWDTLEPAHVRLRLPVEEARWDGATSV